MVAQNVSAANPLGIISDSEVVSLTAAALTLSAFLHGGGRVVVQDRAAGGTITLPASTGSRAKFRIFVKTLLTGSLVIQVANATDILTGVASLTTDIAGTVIPCATTTDTITLNGSTTGGLRGTEILLEDVAAGFWSINGSNIITSGTESTPFSAAV